jgi:hypothetical protein
MILSLSPAQVFSSMTDRQAEDLGMRLEVGGEVHVVAHTRVGHALLGAHLPGSACSRLSPSARSSISTARGVGAARAIPRLVGTGELRRNTASTAPSHIKIALIDFLSSVFLWVSCRHPSVPDRVPMLDFLPLSGALHEAASGWNGRSATAAAMAGPRRVGRSVVEQAQRTRPGRDSRPVIMPRHGTRSSRGRTTARRRRRRGR